MKNNMFAKALLGFDYELYEAPDGKMGSLSEVNFSWQEVRNDLDIRTEPGTGIS